MSQFLNYITKKQKGGSLPGVVSLSQIQKDIQLQKEKKANKKKSGPIVDPRGQWAHPGKDTIIPTKDGRITMQGVSYPVYGEDETGYGQLMMPGEEYIFPGKTIYEKPLNMFNYEMAYGGQMIRRAETYQQGGQPYYRGGGTFSGNMYYQEGGEPQIQDYPDFASYQAAYQQWLASQTGYNEQFAQSEQQPVVMVPITAAHANQKTSSYSGPSVVDMLNSIGKASDYQSRKKLAQELGITNYRGTAAQNTQMMRMLMEGVAQNPTPAPKKAAAKPKAAATQTAAKEQTAAAGDNFFEMAKRAYLAAHPGMTSEQYDRQVAFTGNPNTISQAKTPLKGAPRQGEYSDAFILSQIDRDPRSQKNINKRKRQEFAEDLAMGTLAPWLAEGALMALTTRYLPHGLKALPQVVEKARDASRALPAPMKRLPGPSPRGFVTSQGVRSPGYPMYMSGGPIEGEELEVTPEQLEILRAQGYEFEII